MTFRDAIGFSRRHPIQALFILAGIINAIAYGGSKPEPPPVVTEQGIMITQCSVDSEGLTVKWTSEDERIVPGTTVFIIEARERPIKLGSKTVFQPSNTAWYEIGRTYDYEVAKSGVWTDKTREIRVRTVIEGVAE